MRALVLLSFFAVAGCVTGRGSTEEGTTYRRTLASLVATADSTGDVRDWARVASFAATPPARITPSERAEGCSYAMRADSVLRAMLYSDDLNIRAYGVAFFVDGVRVAQPDSTRDAAMENLGCQQAVR